MAPDQLVAEITPIVSQSGQPCVTTSPIGVDRLGHIAHEANNLLGVIALNLELTLDDLGPDSALREGLLAALTAVFKAADLNDQLCDVMARQC